MAPDGTGDDEWYMHIINHEIAPMIEEYWFDKEDKATIEINTLLN